MLTICFWCSANYVVLNQYKIFELVQSVLFFGAAVASWLVRLTPERAVWVWVLARDIVLCSWARHLTLTVPLSTWVYKWVLANLMLGAILWLNSIPSREGAEIVLVASCYWNWDKLWPDGPLRSYADLTYLPRVPTYSLYLPTGKVLLSVASVQVFGFGSWFLVC